jgi:predicted PurR-regulated permease PerM
MKPTSRYIFIGIGIILAAIAIWYFISIVSYILISAIIALIVRPIVDSLGRIEIRHRKIPKAIRAFVALFTFYFSFFIFFRIFIPIVIQELDILANLDPNTILTALQEPIQHLEHFIDTYSVEGAEKFSVQHFFTQKVTSIFNASLITSTFNSLVSILGNIFIAFFSITFITFFYLRDEKLFAESVLTLVTDLHVEAFRRAMNSSRELLMRYFIGILIQLTGIFTLLTLGLTLAGLGFRHSLLIALIATPLNVIPYVGPLIGAILGLVLGIATHIDLDLVTILFPLTFWIMVVFAVVHLIDNFIFQPFIFSNSVKAHPLEIFLVILIAGSLAGVVGMFLAIPFYTVIRVFSKEFFNNFKVVKKLTKNMQ